MHIWLHTGDQKLLHRFGTRVDLTHLEFENSCNLVKETERGEKPLFSGRASCATRVVRSI